MIDPRLAWFAIGATCSAVMFGWPWHPRFSRYTRTQDPDWRRSFNNENINSPSGPPPLKLRRIHDDDRLDSTALQQGQGSWLGLNGRVFDAYGRTVGYIPRPQSGTPNPPSNP